MIKHLLIFTGLFLTLTSCKTLSFDQVTQTKTRQQLQLGSIGTDKDFMFQQNYNTSAIPKYDDPIKLAVNIKPFNKQTHKAFTKAKELQASGINIVFIDSIPNKSQYIQLQIADKVAVIQSLNTKENNDIKSYLSNNRNTNVLTSLSLALNQNDLESVKSAEAVYLVEEAYKNYALQLFDTNKNKEIISFNQVVVFEYKTSHCCWQENNKYQLNIVDLVSDFNNCPNKTYRSANRAKKHINYFKL